jgi:predicted metal-dependent enzyme (double-stranded beta helix superfamily)
MMRLGRAADAPAVAVAHTDGLTFHLSASSSGAPAAAGRPVATTKGLRRLTAALDALVAAEADPAVVAARTGIVLRRALDDPALLEPRHQEPAPDRYRQHVVHVHPRGLYSVVALVWKPGQATAIHDHVTWCVVGVWRGLEREVAFGRRGRWLVRGDETTCRPGDVSVLVPPEEDIHRVENVGDELAISIHVYGADISVLGSSINRTFGDELVRERARQR